GGLGTFAAWISVVVLHGEARLVGIPWMVLGLAGYFLYRRRAGLSPLQRAKIAHPPRPKDFEELAYKSALVPIFGADVDGHALRRSEFIFLSTLHAPSSEHALGPTATYLLEKRPCRIVVETEPSRNGRPNGAVRPAAETPAPAS